jgi:two-component system chemotaxis sensor kinase CheA
VQYRGRILPLVDMVDLLNGNGTSALVDAETAGDETVHVVVYGDGQRSVGMMVDKIVDIVDHVASASGDSVGGAAGSVVIQQKVTELVDLDAMMRRSDATFLPPAPVSSADAGMGA